MKSNRHTPHLIQAIILGDCNVGKTSICKILNNQPIDLCYQSTIGIDFVQKLIEVNGRQFKLSIWDASGQQKYKALIPGYIRKVSIAFIVFDVTNRKSFNHIGGWVDLVNHYKEDKAFFFLIGNKIDMQTAREVEIEEAEEAARLMGGHYLETSALRTKSVQFLFEEIVNMMSQGRLESPVHRGFRIVRQHSAPKKKCCNC